MKRYRHKRTTSVYYKNSSDLYCSSIDLKATIPCSIVENSNDWEEIIEKDYEILSFIHNKGHAPLYKQHDNNFKRNDIAIFTDGFSESSLLNDINFLIHSVKRLSDGEIFSIGDQTYDGKISKIDVFQYSVAIYINHQSWIGLNVAEHCKQPIFTTEDGFAIYEGDNFYQIYLENRSHFISYIIYPIINFNGVFNNLDILVKRFSTKEAAEEYALLNNPCLSINDIKTVYDGNINYFKELVKSKLKT